MTPTNVFNARIEPFQNGRRSELGESTRVRQGNLENNQQVQVRTGQLHNALPSSADVCVACQVIGGITVPSRPVWSRTSEVPSRSCCTCGQGSEILRRIKYHHGQESWGCWDDEKVCHVRSPVGHKTSGAHSTECLCVSSATRFRETDSCILNTQFFLNKFRCKLKFSVTT